MTPGPTVTIEMRTTTPDGAEYGRRLTVPSDDEAVTAAARRLLADLRSTPEPAGVTTEGVG